VTGVTIAQPAVRQRVQALHLNARILPRKSVENFPGPIAGSIIYDNDLDLYPPFAPANDESFAQSGLPHYGPQ
jgi:hypothetical protein